MDGKPQDQMTVGLVHFMAFPGAAGGDGTLEAFERVCDDDYFGAVEVTSIPDADLRAEVIEKVKAAEMRVGFGAQPALLGGGLDLNAADPMARRDAMDAVKRCFDEAVEWGAEAVCVLSGPDAGPGKREAAYGSLISSLKELCEYGRRSGGIPLILEVFDRLEYGKNCLIGPTHEAVMVARHVAPYYADFGLLIDLSHLPLQEETAEATLAEVGCYLRHVHIGNCVMRDADHPAYGDNHPIFGIPEGENGVEEVTEFLRVLQKSGYIGPEGGNTVSFEVKPFGDQTSEDVLRNCRETLDAAWAAL